MSPPPAKVAKGTSSVPSETNVAVDERKIAVLPKYMAVLRVVIGAVSVVPVAGEEVLQESSSVVVEELNYVEEGNEGDVAQKTDDVEDKDEKDIDVVDDHGNNDDD